MRKKRDIFFFLIFLLFPTVFFGVSSECLGEENDLIITEVMLSRGTGKSSEEFIEIYNLTESDIDLKKLPLKLHLVNSKNSDSSKTLTFINETIPPYGYFVIASKDYAENKDNPDVVSATYSSSGNSLVENGAAYISTSSKEKEGVIDFVGFGNNSYFEKNILENPMNDTSSERIDPKNNNWQESCIKGGTPGKNNSTRKDCESPYLEKIIINEIYSEKSIDFIEIKNISEEKIKIKNWSVSDELGSKVVQSEFKLSPKELYVFEGNFSLNQKDDIAKISDENNRLVDYIKYGKSESSQSYAFDGSAWQWTSKITKGKENEFDELLLGKIKKDKKIYRDVYANFEVNSDKNSKKFTWDFGDKHKSYLRKTRHKYEKSGTYAASLKITGNGKTNILNFSVKVERFEAPKIRIKAVSPNPKGRDTDNEWIEIENKTKKKINLKNWSVATGTKNLVNHPIKKDFEIKAGKTKKLLRKHCAFTLGNTQAKIELRSPDGKAVQKIKYDRKKNKIEEDEIYEKDEEGWNWVKSQIGIEGIEKEQNDTEVASSATSSATNQEDGGNDTENLPSDKDITPTEENSNSDINLTQEEIFSALRKSSIDPRWSEKQKNKIVFLSAGTNVRPPEIFFQNQSRVLGVWTMKKPDPPKEKNWWENVWVGINSGINQILNKI